METRLDHRRSACSNFINKVRSRPGAFAARLTEVFEQDDLPPLLKDWWEQTADENQQDFSLIEERIADYQADVANRDNATS